MNNYEDRTMSHKRVRMDGEGGPGVVQGNGIPLNYMDHLHKVVGHFPADNGHQVGYGAPPGAYGGSGGYYGGGGGAGTAGGDWGEYGPARGLAYAPPAHQPYQQPPPPPPAAAAAAAFLQHQQHLQMQYEQQRHHLQQQAQHHQPHLKWPQSIMQPLQATTEHKMKSEVKTEPSVAAEPLNIPQPLPLTTVSVTSTSSMQLSSDNSGMLGGQVGEDPPKIKIKTDIFKAESPPSNTASNTSSTIPTSTTPAINSGRSNPTPEHESAREKPVESVENVNQPVVTKAEKNLDGETVSAISQPSGGDQTATDASRTNADAGNPTTVIDPSSGENIPVDPNVSKADTVTSDTTATPSIVMPSPSPSSSSEDESKIPNDVYFGTPDAYRAAGSSTTPVTQGATSTTPGGSSTTTPIVVTTPMSEGKKRGRPKGSTNKPKPPELLAAQAKAGALGIGRGQVGRPRGGGNQYLGMRPFKRDFSGIRFRRRWSDDCLESAHIPNEVYFGDVPVSMEILYNYYDANAEREKLQAQQQANKAAGGVPGGTPGTPGNVTLVYSSSSSDDSSDSDSSDDDEDGDNTARQGQTIHRGRGRPRGSKTVNRRSDGPLTPGSVHSGDKGPGITDMKRFLKAAGIEYDYTKLIEGCNSNKERVAKLLNLLREKGLEGEPTLEACRALYTGPPKRRRGPPPGVKKGPRKSKSTPDSDDSDKEEKPAKELKVKPVKISKIVNKTPKTPKTPANPEDGSRRLTRGQTSGKPRQKIIISSDEEDSPLSKLRLKK